MDRDIQSIWPYNAQFLVIASNSTWVEDWAKRYWHADYGFIICRYVCFREQVLGYNNDCTFFVILGGYLEGKSHGWLDSIVMELKLHDIREVPEDLYSVINGHDLVGRNLERRQ